MKSKHKHDFQLLSYGNKAVYVGTLTEMVVLMVCRDCGKVFEEKVEFNKGSVPAFRGEKEEE